MHELRSRPKYRNEASWREVALWAGEPQERRQPLKYLSWKPGEG